MTNTELIDEYARLRDEFKAKGLGGRIGYGEKPALLIVDLITGFTDSRSPLSGELESQLAATNALLVPARELEIPIFFSTVAYDTELQEAGLWIKKIPSNHLLVEGSEWVEVDSRLGQLPHEMTLVKKYASCFFGTDLAARLISRGVDTIIIVGCTTKPIVSSQVRTPGGCGYWVLCEPGTQAKPPKSGSTSRSCQVMVTVSQ